MERPEKMVLTGCGGAVAFPERYRIYGDMRRHYTNFLSKKPALTFSVSAGLTISSRAFFEAIQSIRLRMSQKHTFILFRKRGLSAKSHQKPEQTFGSF